MSFYTHNYIKIAQIFLSNVPKYINQTGAIKDSVISEINGEALKLPCCVK